MSGPRVCRFLALVIGAAMGLACGDYARSTSPPQIHQKLLPPTLVVGSPFSLVAKGFMAEAVKWGPAHETVEQRVSAVVGPDGGTLSIAGADFSITIPPGALIEPTTITVVAKAGVYVVYDMYPHGLKFRQPVTAVQGLSTIAGYGTPKGKSVRTAYLPDGKELISRNGFASATELQAVTTYFYGAEPIAETQESILNHFSRYILVSNVWTEVDDDEDDEDTGDSIIGGDSSIESLERVGTYPIDSLEIR